MEIKTVVAFIAGATVGAVATLMLAPKSGADLRADMAREAQAEREHLRQEYARATGEIQERLDKAQSDLHASLQQIKERGHGDDVPAGEVEAVVADVIEEVTESD